MSYNKLGFTSGQTLKAEHLNHMEDGIANVSWNDLTDKPFGEEKAIKEVLPESQSIHIDGNYFSVSGDAISLEIGKTYVVTYNGNEYECTAQHASLFGGRSNFDYLGNLGLYTSDVPYGTEPFLIVIYSGMDDGVACNCYASDEITSFTIAISIVDTTVHKIDEKYLPYGEYTPEPITWDGTVGDRVNVPLGGTEVYLVKVSDKILSVQDCIGAQVWFSDGSAEGVPEDLIFALDGAVAICKGMVMSVSGVNVDVMGMPIVFPETGTYFANTPDGYTSSLVFPSQVKTLDTKYLPDHTHSMIINGEFDDNSNISLDKTYAEIEDAIFKGIVPYINAGGKMYSLSSNGSQDIEFTNINVLRDGTVFIGVIKINRYTNESYKSYQFTATETPN